MSNFRMAPRERLERIIPPPEPQEIQRPVEEIGEEVQEDTLSNGTVSIWYS